MIQQICELGQNLSGSYNPETGISIYPNLVTFGFIMLLVAVILGSIGRRVSFEIETSDMIAVAIFYIVMILVTVNVPYVNGDPIIVALLLNVISVLLKRVIERMGIFVSSVTLLTNSSLLLFYLVKQQMFIDSIWLKIELLKSIISFKG